jgi:hypothetical protein
MGPMKACLEHVPSEKGDSKVFKVTNKKKVFKHVGSTENICIHIWIDYSTLVIWFGLPGLPE